MDQDTLQKILEAQKERSFSSPEPSLYEMLPTGEGRFEQILDILGLRDSYEQLLVALRLSSSVSFYLFVVVAFFIVFFSLRAWRINSYVREKRKQKFQ